MGEPALQMTVSVSLPHSLSSQSKPKAAIEQMNHKTQTHSVSAYPPLTHCLSLSHTHTQRENQCQGVMDEESGYVGVAEMKLMTERQATEKTRKHVGYETATEIRRYKEIKMRRGRDE